jgi:hypothetical protein
VHVNAFVLGMHTKARQLCRLLRCFESKDSREKAKAVNVACPRSELVALTRNNTGLNCVLCIRVPHRVTH